LIPRKLPLTRPPSFVAALPGVYRNGPQRCLGETRSHGSETDLSHGCEGPPTKPNSAFSVRPPDVEKK
jgi:hypothetical protein